MPEGVIAEVVDGYATLDFVDPVLRGPALNRLLAIGGVGSIQTLTREGPRRKYRVPEGNAAEAGLLDTFAATLRGDTGNAQALATAHAAQAANPKGPTTPTSVNTYVGTTTYDEARKAPSVSTTVSGGPGVGSTHPPAHSEVIAKVTAPHYPRPRPVPNRGPVESAAATDIPVDSEPSERWRRDELDAYARRLGLDTVELATKTEVLEAIRKV